MAGKQLAKVNRDFVSGLSLESIQIRNFLKYNNKTSPSLIRVYFSTPFPSSGRAIREGAHQSVFQRPTSALCQPSPG